jgi:hypothetical protein
VGGREDQIWRHQHTRAPTETYFPGAGVQSSNFDGRSSKRISGSKHSTFDSLGGTRDQQESQASNAEKAEMTSVGHG